MAQKKTLRQTFLDQLGEPLQLATLFEYLPGVCFYVKDRQSRLIAANRALLTLRGLAQESQIVGLSDYDLHPRYLADRYVSEDRQVMDSGRPLPDQVWLVPGERGTLRWFLSSKIPLFDQHGTAIGLAGMMRDLQQFGTEFRPMAEMDPILRSVLDHYSERISVTTLAAQAGWSVSQFDRRFKALFQMTPRDYILRVRINAARHLIVTTTYSIAEVALRCGFYDQSSFAKHFRQHFQQTPTAFRKCYQGEAMTQRHSG